jgi:HAD superfamily hydrolase (TIGR01509 family)
LVSEHGGTWTREDGLALVGADMEATGTALRARGVHLTTLEIVAHLVGEVSRSLRGDVPWRPGAWELVKALRDARVPQAIVTTSPVSMAQAVADRLPKGAIGAIIAGEHVMRSKPDPEPYLRAARALGAHPGRCVAIEDSSTGLASAIAAGTIAIGVPHDAEVVCDGAWVRLATLDGVTMETLQRLCRAASAMRRSRGDRAFTSAQDLDRP